MSKVAQAAVGKWPGILTSLGIDQSFLKNTHGPCPACGGKDRFRFDDKDGRGSYFCSGCSAGDGSSVLYGRRLAMHQLAQPDVMAQLLDDRMANGQGFLARCLVAWPESTIGSRYIETFEQPEYRQEIKRLFAKLKTLTEAKPLTGKNEQELDPVELPLTDDAKQVLIAASNEFETLMQTGNDLAELRDRASKAIENACRIAGVMTVVEDGLEARTIDADRLSRHWLLSSGT